MIVIGSTALKIGLEDAGLSLGRVPVDLDLMGFDWEILHFAEENELELTEVKKHKYLSAIGGKHIEFEILDSSLSGQRYSKYLSYNIDTHIETFYDEDMLVAPLEVLYSIKKAHRHYPRQWKKHIQDFLLLDEFFAGNDRLAEITAIREKETKEREGLKTPSLNKTAADFFNDNVSNRTFIHDEIHQIMAHYEKPLYESIKIDPNLVKCSREKFDNLPYQKRLECVLEEAYVIALERAVIPMIFAGGQITTSDKAFDWAIMRICTNLTSGWFREFALLNYHKIMEHRNKFYVDKFLEAVDTGKIKQIETK
jgi:hypothetical protein